MKKAQGLPITTVILATLGLLVLVILFAITTGRLTIFNIGVQTCPGSCVVSEGACTDKAGYVLPGKWLNPADQTKCPNVCCSAK